MVAKEVTGPLGQQLTKIAESRKFGKRGPKVDFTSLKKSVWYDVSEEYKNPITVYASGHKQGFKVRTIKDGGKVYVMVLSKLEPKKAEPVPVKVT